MNGPMRRVALGLFLAFLVLALDVTYWQIIAADRLREHPQNARAQLARSGRERGQIISSDTVVLATSVPDPSDPRYYVREYPHGPLYAHTVGFSSPLFGDSGLERSQAGVLTSGRDLTVSGIINALVGEDRRARSIQITLNHRLQRTAARALGSRYGALVAIEPTTGRLLALASSPTFDPNFLIGAEAATVWNALGRDPSRPLQNRATGRWLPGDLLPADAITGIPSGPDTSSESAFSLALRTAAVATGGQPMRPYVVARVFDRDSQLESETEPIPFAQRLSGEEVATLRDSMDVLEIDSARFGPIRGLGASGTDRDPYDRQRIWFVGFLPLGQPAIAVAVVIESVAASGSRGTGTAEAASIGRAVMVAWLDQQSPLGR